MTDTLTPLSPADVAARINGGHALLIDIREPDEFARRHVPGAVSLPLSRFDLKPLPVLPGTAVVFTCKTGMRTGGNAARLAAPVAGEAFVLAGGVDAWAAAGLPVTENAQAPLEMNRQVQIGAGSLVLAGALLGWLVDPAFHALSAFVGAGLVFAGVSGFCGMAKVLALLPWNRAAA
jgi:rhodanese-related sulfurtransferase